MTFRNVYDDPRCAASYARLEFPGTYYLAYRDLPSILERHARGKRALDFGCGAGRSARFLRGLGFEVIGVDIAREMIREARARDPNGEYRLIGPDGPRELRGEAFDLVLSAFTFDNVPGGERKVALLADLAALLAHGGVLVNLVSSPDLYVHEWASFTTRDFPGNRAARSGDPVLIVVTDVEDRRPVEDVLCDEAEYRRAYAEAGLELIATYHPLGRDEEPYAWKSEITLPPWAIYVLARREGRRLR